MKIKLAILGSDVSYLRKIVSVFNIKYADKLEVYSFTDMNTMFSELDENRVDVVLAEEVFDVDTKRLSPKCGFAYLVDKQGIESFRDQQAISKFQKADLIYKQILSVYSEKASAITGFGQEASACRILSFISAGGGMGCSVVAAAYAKRMAMRQKKVLYLNLEMFADTDLFFRGEGQFNFSDIIYALRNQKTNLSLKLESSIRQDPSGVMFYAGAKVSLDLKELKAEDVKRLLLEVRNAGTYDIVVIDSDFGADSISMAVWNEANGVVAVTDGEEISNKKLEKMYQVFRILEKKEDNSYLGKLTLLYNKFSSKTGSLIQGMGIPEIGGIPRYDHATAGMIVEKIASLDLLDKIG
ncbi:MAG: AAA family ATPase [Lachnospiraceae bacterium]|nr:AAA family ATPase [Lachnospiraceae bacterium]